MAKAASGGGLLACFGPFPSLTTQPPMASDTVNSFW
jgi:hypothetical protein